MIRMDGMIHIRMECVRLIMESHPWDCHHDAMQAAEQLVDYIVSGHIRNKANGRSKGGELAN